MASRPGRDGRVYKRAAAQFQRECREVDASCWLCGQRILYDEDSTAHPDAFQLDHLHPVSTHPDLAEDPANFRPSHRSCNIARGNNDPAPGLGLNSRVW